MSEIPINDKYTLFIWKSVLHKHIKPIIQRVWDVVIKGIDSP